MVSALLRALDFLALCISMALTMILGLTLAAVLTALAVPVFYAVFFRVPPPEERSWSPRGFSSDPVAPRM